MRPLDQASGTRGRVEMAEPSESSTKLSREIDDQVFRLRREGRAFTSIRRDLGLAKPLDAQKAFRRVVRRLPPSDREVVLAEGGARLASLTALVNADTTLSAKNRVRRLAAVDRLRSDLLETDSDIQS